jgi:hypothetical protein
MGGNYISKITSRSFFFLSFLTQVEEFFRLQIMASSSNHGYSFMGDSSNISKSNSFNFSSSSDNGMKEMFANMDK